MRERDIHCWKRSTFQQNTGKVEILCPAKCSEISETARRPVRSVCVRMRQEERHQGPGSCSQACAHQVSPIPCLLRKRLVKETTWLSLWLLDRARGPSTALWWSLLSITSWKDDCLREETFGLFCCFLSLVSLSDKNGHFSIHIKSWTNECKGALVAIPSDFTCPSRKKVQLERRAAANRLYEGSGLLSPWSGPPRSLSCSSLLGRPALLSVSVPLVSTAVCRRCGLTSSLTCLSLSPLGCPRFTGAHLKHRTKIWSHCPLRAETQNSGWFMLFQTMQALACP